jgi:hypothetical protein
MKRQNINILLCVAATPMVEFQWRWLAKKSELVNNVLVRK